MDETQTRQTYDAANRLRYVVALTTRRYEPGDTTETATTEYRYDALGRRIQMRYRGRYQCRQENKPECRGTDDQQMWDGDVLLAETRQMENGFAGGSSTSPGFAGDVVYTHGRTLDLPVSFTRRSAGAGCVFTVFPHADFQGRLATGTFAGTAPACARVDWPAQASLAYRQKPTYGATAPWNGSLASLSQDASGLQYLRNRYLDPKTGQFTQADPLGVAGGLNLYGFADGDPVNYADPFGLCPPCMGEELLLPGLGGAAAGAAGATAMAAQQATNQAIANSIDAAVDALRDKVQIKFVTYTRTGPGGQVYSGRTSGFGDPQSIANARAAGHPARLAGFGPAVVDEWATGAQGYAAIRGREQQLIDAHGGAQSEGGTSANTIRGVSKKNPLAGVYDAAATSMFGPLPRP